MPPPSPQPPPKSYRFTSGLLLVAAGLGAASLAPADPSAPAPAQLEFLPGRAPVGARVVLEGEGLQTARAVRFGGREAPCRMNARGVETWVPEGATTGPITLLTASGSCTTGAVFQVSPERPGPPAIARFWPASGPEGSELTVSGTGLASVEEVSVAGHSARFSVLSDHDLVLYIGAEQGSGLIALRSPFGSGVSARSFQVTAPEVQ